MAKLTWFDRNTIDGELKGPPYRKSWALVTEKTCGAQNVSVGYNETPVGGEVPRHKHDKEEEIMYFIEGKGEFRTDSEIIQIRPGIIVYNPPGDFHNIVNTGDTPIKFVWVYSPQLESQRVEK
jgi:putative monooxygenase